MNTFRNNKNKQGGWNTMSMMTIKRMSWMVALVLSVSMPLATASEAVVETLEDYFMMAGPTGGSLGPEQIPAEEWANFVVVDTRSAARFEAGAIPNAIHIEWREVLSRQDELPSDQPLLLYCDTGVLSAQAMMALKLTGFEKAKVLRGGYAAWVAEQAKR
jgi:rhodanese-related sulfurtransferase